MGLVAEPSAGAIAGALADEHRRSVFAAIQLGSEHVDAVIAATQLTAAQVGKALGKLVDVGIVDGSAGRLRVVDTVFQHAAREARRGRRSRSTTSCRSTPAR